LRAASSHETATAIARGVSAPADVAAFGRVTVAVLDSALPGELVGAYFVGSIALGGYVPGESDVDVVAVCRRAVPDATKRALADRLLEAAITCPARGLELTLYRSEVASSPTTNADFELNVNGGPRMERVVRLSAVGEPRFWYVLDRAVAQRSGVTLFGPPADEVFAATARHVVLQALIESVRWHREHEKATLYSVLNACRAWRFAEDDVLGSKLEGARWARLRWPVPTLIDAAVDLREGRPGQLDADEVDRLLGHVAGVLAQAERA
jgi:hypothetical protein